MSNFAYQQSTHLNSPPLKEDSMKRWLINILVMMETAIKGENTYRKKNEICIVLQN